MRCCYCGNEITHTASVSVDPSGKVTRVRQCKKCNRRFVTEEKYTEYRSSQKYKPLQSDVMKRPHKYYTVYNAKTDEIIASGTSGKCAEMMGTSLKGFYSIVSRTKDGKIKKYEIVVDRVKND